MSTENIKDEAWYICDLFTTPASYSSSSLEPAPFAAFTLAVSSLGGRDVALSLRLRSMHRAKGGEAASLQVERAPQLQLGIPIAKYARQTRRSNG